MARATSPASEPFARRGSANVKKKGENRKGKAGAYVSRVGLTELAELSGRCGASADFSPYAKKHNRAPAADRLDVEVVVIRMGLV